MAEAADAETVRLQLGQATNDIKKSDVHKVIKNAIVQLTPDSKFSLPDEFRGAHHHNHVGRINLTAKCEKENHDLGSLDIYKQSLKDAISGLVDDATRNRVLRQVAYGIHHLHSHNRAHGQLSVNSIFLSCDGRNHPVILEAPSSGNEIESTKEKDLNDLGHVFHYVLTGGRELISGTAVNQSFLICGEKEVAEDIILKLVTKTTDSASSITIEKVLDHPLFWTDDKKVEFLCDNFSSVYMDEDKIKHLEPEARKVVFDDDWKTNLSLKSHEKDAIEDQLSDGRGSVDPDMIFNMAKKKKSESMNLTVYLIQREEKLSLVKAADIRVKKWKKFTNMMQATPLDQKPTDLCKLLRGKSRHKHIKDSEFEVFEHMVVVKDVEEGGYDGKSLYDLLRFFRNKKSHYWEGGEDFKLYLRVIGGYWKFFSSRYPSLLMFVYNNRNAFPFHDFVSAPRQEVV